MNFISVLKRDLIDQLKVALTLITLFYKGPGAAGPEKNAIHPPMRISNNPKTRNQRVWRGYLPVKPSTTLSVTV